MKFLIIDDSVADRELVIRKLRKEFPEAEFIQLGRQTETFEDVLKQGEYDVVLTDYQLNWTNGITILKTIKRHHPEVPVIMFTGTGNEEVAVEGMRAGLSNYVLKKHLDNLPFAVRESLEKIRLRKQYDDAIEQLRRSEERYREIFEQGLTGIFVCSPEGQMITCNAAFANIFRFASTEEAVGSPLSSLYPDPDAFAAFIQRVRQERILENYEVALCRQDGETVYVVENVVGDFDEEGKLVEIKGYLFDTTERKKLEAQFLQAQKMESLGQLVSGIAHDFNNMLGGILGHTDRALSRVNKDHPLYENLTHTREIAERAAKMTRQLLAFSRQQILEPRDVNLNTIISDLLDFLGKILMDQITIEFLPGEELKAIHADPTQIQQVLMNLCINARDAMPDGGKLTIQTRNVTCDALMKWRYPEAQLGDYVVLMVRDTGMGMDEAVQEHIFEPFFTTKEQGKGTGLGLSMVHGVVGQHKGFIDVQSRAGKGTTFTIYLPAAGCTVAPIHQEEETQRTLRTGNETVLLVEDDPDLRFLMNEVLQEYGYIIMSACDGEEGLKMFQKHADAIALVVADVITPKMRGKELYDRIQELRPHTKFLFVSGYQPDQISQNFVLSDGLHFLQKPFDLDDLVAKVSDLLL